MRTLTANEVDVVSGGEGACFATKCGPMPEADWLALENALYGVAATAATIGHFTKNQAANGVAVVAGLFGWLAGQAGGGGGDSDKDKDKEKQKRDCD